MTPLTTSTGSRTRAASRTASRSATMGQPLGQDPRQSRGDDLGGGGAVIIVDASEPHLPLVLVPDGVAGPGIGVARLAHATDVDHVAAPGLEGDAERPLADRAGEVGAARAHRPDPRLVGVADEAQAT